MNYIKMLPNLTVYLPLCHPDLMDSYANLKNEDFGFRKNLTLKDEDFGFWKNLILIGIFFVVTPLTLGISLFSLFSLKSHEIAEGKFNTTSLTISPKSGAKVFASLPDKIPSISSSIESADARPEIVAKYLKNYNSPLLPYANKLVEVADKYSLDFRLVTAIAQQESNLCKIIPPGSYNCWGWGIHSEGTLGFTSYEEGIESVSKGLREEYLNKGYSTVEEIMSKYTPLSNGSWAFGVESFMQDME